MAKCSARHFVLTICTLQLIVVVECQVFDFMGFMYGPILANFFHIIFIILGFFGAFQYSTKYILSYTLWNVFWVGWTIFVICFYLDTGVLNKNSDMLNLGTGSRSWWEIHGYGCIADFTSTINGSSLEQDPDPSRPPKPTKVEGCLIEYQYVEVIQAAVQCLFAILATASGIYMSKVYLEEDDSWECFLRLPNTLRKVPGYVRLVTELSLPTKPLDPLLLIGGSVGKSFDNLQQITLEHDTKGVSPTPRNGPEDSFFGRLSTTATVTDRHTSLYQGGPDPSLEILPYYPRRRRRAETEESRNSGHNRSMSIPTFGASPVLWGLFGSGIPHPPTQIKEPQGPPLRPPSYTYQTSRGHLDQYQQQIRGSGYGPRSVSPRPMTPRRVKRRSILARDTMNRSSLTHRRQGSSRSRSSQRRARAHQNPVTRLLEQQNRFLDSSITSTSFNDSSSINPTNFLSGREDSKDFDTTNRFKSGLNNPVFQQSSNSSLNQSGGDEVYRPNSARSSYSNYHASRPVSYLHNNEYFSNQAVAQVPISTNRSKGVQRNEETQNNLYPNKSTATLKSFSQKNFNFLGFNLKNNNINSNNNNNHNNNNNNINNNNCSFSNNHSNNSSGGMRHSKRFRVDLTRTGERTSNSFFSQGPPAYREGGLDSETVI